MGSWIGVTSTKRSSMGPSRARPGASSASGLLVSTVVLTKAIHFPWGATLCLQAVHKMDQNQKQLPLNQCSMQLLHWARLEHGSISPHKAIVNAQKPWPATLLPSVRLWSLLTSSPGIQTHRPENRYPSVSLASDRLLNKVRKASDARQIAPKERSHLRVEFKRKVPMFFFRAKDMLIQALHATKLQPNNTFSELETEGAMILSWQHINILWKVTYDKFSALHCCPIQATLKKGIPSKAERKPTLPKDIIPKPCIYYQKHNHTLVILQTIRDTIWQWTLFCMGVGHTETLFAEKSQYATCI